MNKLALIGVTLTCSILGGFALGYYWASLPIALPADFDKALDRFSFVNESTNQTLTVFKVVSRVEFTMADGNIIESYIVSFEDRYGLPESDNDFFDTIVEMKRVKGSGFMTIRVVQLSLDWMDVYLDGKMIGRAGPSVKTQIQTSG